MILLQIPEGESIKSSDGNVLNGPLTLEVNDETNKVIFTWPGLKIETK